MESPSASHLTANQKIIIMKNSKKVLKAGAAVAAVVAVALCYQPGKKQTAQAATSKTKPCVFLTLFGDEPIDSSFRFKTTEKVNSALANGLVWAAKAQQEDGGWGAGTHARQDIMDPHAVKSDPATTAMVSMAILRSGSTLREGTYSSNLKKGTEFLLAAVEASTDNNTNVTSLTGTQIQVKLGSNIDVVLTAQFLSNLMDHLDKDAALKKRVSNDLGICVKKIQGAQNANGSFKGAGWAGVLQSSFATNALESARSQGVKVDTAVLHKAQDYQTGNYDYKSGSARTEDGAGVMLYSVSSSVRANSAAARDVETKVEQAKKEGKLGKDAKIDEKTLMQLGYNATDAMKSVTSYNVYQSGKATAQQSNVMNGFGSNGGEEFLSYLQTGESMIIGKDTDWKKWYDNVSGKLLSIQNPDGSWNGHHCISSPVFCTATCLLILSVNNDIDKLVAMGSKGK